MTSPQMSVDEADSLWTKVQSTMGFCKEQNQAIGCWLIGKHGDDPLSVTLKKDKSLKLCLVQDDENENIALFERLPRINYSAGLYSVVHSIAPCVIRSGMLLCSDEGVLLLPERLRRMFVHYATQPTPACNPTAIYDGTKESMSITSAELVANEAFRIAIKTMRPKNSIEFGDQWAREAHAFVMGEKHNCSALPQASASHLQILGARNIHNATNALVAQAKIIKERFEYEEINTQEIAEQRKAEYMPYLNARRASSAAYQMAREQALRVRPVNRKPFSQRLITGLILAKAASARLKIGTLSESIGETLAARYGEALRFMQDTEVVVSGRQIAELYPRNEVGCGAFYLSYPEGVLLTQPRVVLNANVVIIDPRAIFHEFQHVRQYTTSEEKIADLATNSQYETQVVEWKAKQAEADFVNEFGIMY